MSCTYVGSQFRCYTKVSVLILGFVLGACGDISLNRSALDLTDTSSEVLPNPAPTVTPSVISHTGLWTWMGGPGGDVLHDLGNYGPQGVALSTNFPSSRDSSVNWVDGTGSFWMFSGECTNCNEAHTQWGVTQDLWKFDGTDWILMGGVARPNEQTNFASNQAGNYGVKGLTAPSNFPLGREYAAFAQSPTGIVFMYGGDGFTSVDGTNSIFSDLWKFDGTQWTWIAGQNPTVTSEELPNYGILGVAASTNTPGAVDGSGGAWADASGNFWIFGGYGYDSLGAKGFRNDLWKFDGTNWTWMGGSNLVGQAGVYGTKGVPSPGNWPGGRTTYGKTSWVDSDGNFWLFGGDGNDTVGSFGLLSDLWKYDGTLWTWMGGSNLMGQAGVYGTLGIADSNNMPGGRESPALWTDGAGKLWLFGGAAMDSSGTFSSGLNDLWMFDGANWTWLSGSDVYSATSLGIYGTKGMPDPANTPPMKWSPNYWRDLSGALWLYGGFQTVSSGIGSGDASDFWKYEL